MRIQLNIFQETAKECAMKMFKQLDKENAGEISEEQFIVGCINDPGIVFAISNLQTEESWTINIKSCFFIYSGWLDQNIIQYTHLIIKCE